MTNVTQSSTFKNQFKQKQETRGISQTGNKQYQKNSERKKIKKDLKTDSTCLKYISLHLHPNSVNSTENAFVK